MSAYFDAKAAALLALSHVYNSGTLGYDQFTSQMQKIEEAITGDVSVCVMWPGFPTDIKEQVFTAFITYSEQMQTRFEVHIPNPRARLRDYADEKEQMRGIITMTNLLHDLFHDLAKRKLEGFSDSPFEPMQHIRGKIDLEILSFLQSKPVPT